MASPHTASTWFGHSGTALTSHLCGHALAGSPRELADALRSTHLAEGEREVTQRDGSLGESARMLLFTEKSAKVEKESGRKADAFKEPGRSTMEASDISAVSRLFSAGVLHEMSCMGKSPLFSRLAEQAGLFQHADPTDSVGDIFDIALSILRLKPNRHEYVYKAAITQNVLLGRHSLHTSSMITEFRVGDCKADVAIFNGTSTAYEIKTERDNLSRLTRQVSAYRSVFAAVYVIAGENHVEEVLDATPVDVGVMLLAGSGSIKTIRRAIVLPDRTCPAAIFNSLRSEEAKRVLTLSGIEIPQLPNIALRAALEAEFMKLSPQAAHAGMVAVLRKTRSLLPLANLITQLPPSLHSAALSTPLKRADHPRLVGAVNAPSTEATKWAYGKSVLPIFSRQAKRTHYDS